MNMELTDAERLYLTLAVQNQIVVGQMLLQKLNPPQPQPAQDPPAS